MPSPLDLDALKNRPIHDVYVLPPPMIPISPEERDALVAELSRLRQVEQAAKALSVAMEGNHSTCYEKLDTLNRLLTGGDADGPGR